MEKVDFVLLWVDGNDPEWLKDFNRHKDIEGDRRVTRYRDWNNLQYLFRAFENFTPWVNKIYFVTYGHLPKWLNIRHPKLVVVNHGDYLDKENLPVFSSHSLEIGFHKIKGLSDNFVYFNDDMFLTKKISYDRFFKNGLPIDTAIGNIMHQGDISHIICNNIDVINKYFDKYTVIKNHFFKWFNPKYGFHLFRTLFLMPWHTFTGFYGYHQPQPFLKKTYEELWKKEPELLERVSKNKFRCSSDVNQYLFRYWQLVKGEFYPESYKITHKDSKYIELYTMEDVQMAAKDILSGKFDMYCPNDGLDNLSDEEFNKSVELINNALDSLLPNKSSFEK